MKVTGIVLAGGASSRMGSDKAVVEVAGVPMSRLVVSALRRACDRVLVAGRAAGLEGADGLADPPGPERRGPLAGLVAALGEVREGTIALVAVDQPWLRPETVRGLARVGGDLPVVPVHDGVRQTTCALYPASIWEVAREELSAGGSIQSVLDRTAFVPVAEETWLAWGEDGRSWFSVDTPGALEEGLRRFGPPAGVVP